MGRLTMKYGWITIVCITLLAPLFERAEAKPKLQPLVRNQNCPTGYHVSGQYCVPSDTARFSLPGEWVHALAGIMLAITTVLPLMTEAL